MLSSNLKIIEEEKFLINILFKEKKVVEKEINFDNINYELLVKIASEHLMLPSLYINLTKKGFIDLIPLELKIYFKEIYTINKKRNQEALNEANEISRIWWDAYRRELLKNNGKYDAIETAKVAADAEVNAFKTALGGVKAAGGGRNTKRKRQSKKTKANKHHKKSHKKRHTKSSKSRKTK